MSARLDPQRESLRAWLTASAAQWRKVEAEARENAERFEQTLAIIGEPPRDRFDKVPLADVVREPHVEAETTPAPDATPTRATMRRPASAFTPRPVGRQGGSLNARVLSYLAEHGETAPFDLADGLKAHPPSVMASLSKLLGKGAVTKRRNGSGKGVLYALAAAGEDHGRADPRAAGVSAEQRAPEPHAADVGNRPVASSAAPDPVPEPAPPVVPRKVNGTEPPAALTGALKLVARDVLKALQIGPMTEMELFQKTGWPFGTIRTVANTLRAEGKLAGTDKLSLKGAADE